MKTPKAERERHIFAEFASVAGLEVDPNSISSAEPPSPDMEFILHGNRHFAELVEVTDQGLARRIHLS